MKPSLLLDDLLPVIRYLIDPSIAFMAQFPRLVTGGLVDHIAVELAAAAEDPDEKTKKTIADALIETGAKKPVMTISSIMWMIANKVSMSHRVTLLQIMETIVSNNLSAIKPEFAQTIIGFSLGEMTADKVCFSHETFLSVFIFFINNLFLLRMYMQIGSIPRVVFSFH